MKNSYLQPIANKISKRSKKIIYADELKGIIGLIMKDQYTDKKAYKLMYHLKNKGYLISLKKNIFYIKKPQHFLSEQLIIEDNYRPILHTHCTATVGKHRYIGGIKAFEMNFHNYDIPEEVQVVTSTKQSTEVVISNKLIHFKKYTQKDKDLFKAFKKYTTKVKFGRYSLPIAVKELAVLEALYNFDTLHDRYAYELIKKSIRKTKERDIRIRETIVKTGKHHSSLNRLYGIAKQVNTSLAKQLFESIKKYSFVVDA